MLLRATAIAYYTNTYILYLSHIPQKKQFKKLLLAIWTSSYMHLLEMLYLFLDAQNYKVDEFNIQPDNYCFSELL